MSRRGFLQTLGAGGAAAFLAACGISGSSGTPHNRDNPVATPVDLSDTNKTLTWANWTLYLDYDEEKKVYPTLRQFEKESGINVVSTLEQILESAKRGEVINCLIVTVNSDDSCSRAWANGHHPFSLLGQLENAKASFMEANLE